MWPQGTMAWFIACCGWWTLPSSRQGGTFCLGGYIAPSIPGGGKVHGKLLDHLDLRSVFFSMFFWVLG